MLRIAHDVQQLPGLRGTVMLTGTGVDITLVSTDVEGSTELWEWVSATHPAVTPTLLWPLNPTLLLPRLCCDPQPAVAPNLLGSLTCCGPQPAGAFNLLCPPTCCGPQPAVPILSMYMHALCVCSAAVIGTRLQDKMLVPCVFGINTGQYLFRCCEPQHRNTHATCACLAI